MTIEPRQTGAFLAVALLYGAFMTAWSSFELVVEVVIMRRLRLSAAEASTLLAGLGFGAKANILYSLLEADPGEHENIKKIRRLLNDAERNSIVHSFIVLRGTNIVFMRREVKNKYTVREKIFTASDFKHHVDHFMKLALEIQNNLSVSDEDLEGYIQHMLASSQCRASQEAPRPG